jgi:hypothetical protein
MTIRTLTIVAPLLLILVSTAIPAEERVIAGSEHGTALVAGGATDAITSPVTVFTEIGKDTKDFGPGGVVTGAVRGGLKAGGQALKGGARMAIGILDVLVSPFVDSE